MTRDGRPSLVFVRLLLLLSCVVLLTSRVMLVLHEFCGHGAVASAFGGRITGWFLFFFAGGRVTWEAATLGVGQRLVISLGGIALELVIGAVAFGVAERLRERPVARFGVTAVGTVLVGHGALYLARGAHYGFGDGAVLARVLGDSRWTVVLAASALAVATALYGGRRLTSLPASLFASPPWRAALLTLLVFVGSGIVHGGLAWIEVRWFPDPRWAAIMEDASVVAARAELRRRLADATQRGEPPPAPTDQERLLAELERARRPWPLDPLLAGAVLTALVIGVGRGARPDRGRERERERGGADVRLPRWTTIGRMALLLAVALLAIAVLRRLGS